MADFRKLFYALAMVALVVGLSIPASAQGGAITCNAFTNPTFARAEGYAELVGDLVMTCTGGTPTTPGQPVPQLNIQVFLSTNITSKLTGNGFNEALLIVDEPNSPTNPTRGIRNCGAASEDTGPAGAGVCAIIAPSSPTLTYDGSVPGNPTPPLSTLASAANYGSTRPNVFQGRQAQSTGTTGISSSIVFAGVPFDPPGTTTTRTLRITNVRADAEFLGVVSGFTVQPVLMSVGFSNTGFLAINNSANQLVVANVLRGLQAPTIKSQPGFLQCTSVNAALISTSTSGSGPASPQVTLTEGFQNAWKAKNVSFITNSGSGSGTGFIGNGTIEGGYTAGSVNYPSDLAQNVPGANYNTESGFEYNSTTPIPLPNPPSGLGTAPIPPGSNTSIPLSDGTATGSRTGIQNAGVATQGTRLALFFTNPLAGVTVFVPAVVTLNNSSNRPGGSGVMVATVTDASGSGAYSPTTATAGLVAVPSSGVVVWEVLFADPSSVETAVIPITVAYISALNTNPPIGSPTPGFEQVAANFAPFSGQTFTATAARQPSATLPVPRFLPNATAANIFGIVKCACDILFPFVSSTSGFDTGIAIANTSMDPFGIAAAQQGTVTFNYYGTGANGTAPPTAQTSANVPAGQVLTYVLSTGGGGIGTATSGLDNRASGFQGYIIAQAGFQYCHGFAFITEPGGGPTAGGISEGYLGIIIDNAGLPRTNQLAEIQSH